MLLAGDGTVGSLASEALKGREDGLRQKGDLGGAPVEAMRLRWRD